MENAEQVSNPGIEQVPNRQAIHWMSSDSREANVVHRPVLKSYALLCTSPRHQEEKGGVSCNIRRGDMDHAWDHWNMNDEDSSLMHTVNLTPSAQIQNIQIPSVYCQQYIHPCRLEGERTSMGTVHYLWEPLQPTCVFPVNRSCYSGPTTAEAMPRRSSWLSPSMTPDSLVDERSPVAQPSQWMSFQERSMTLIDVSEGRPIKSTAEPSNNVQIADQHDRVSFHCFPSYPVPEMGEERIFHSSRCVEYGYCGAYQFPDITTAQDTIQYCGDKIHDCTLPPSGHGLPFDASHRNWSGDKDYDSWDNAPYESTDNHSWTGVEDDTRFPVLHSNLYSNNSPFSSNVYTPDTTMTPSDMELSIVDEPNTSFSFPCSQPHPQTEEEDTLILPQSSTPIPKHRGINRNQRPRNLSRHLRPRAKPGPNSQRSISKDAFLIDCKRRGMSYRDIKRLGGFEEAESTLRGRYRTLTKRKELRVRKPQWREKDVSFPKPRVYGGRKGGKGMNNVLIINGVCRLNSFAKQ